MSCKDCICSEVCYYKAFNEVRVLEKRRHDVEKICKSFVHRDSLKKSMEVVHGKWAIDEEDIKWGNSLKKRYCTNCGKRPHFDKENREFILSDYCPNCGSKMDGEEK